MTCQRSGSIGLVREEPLLIERSRAGRRAGGLPALDVPSPAPEPALAGLLREEAPPLPELSETELVRHYFRLSQWNYCVDSGVYPLGSCTMKHNPRINEKLARLSRFAGTHPYDPEPLAQGNLELMHRLQEALCALSGFAAVTVQPAAGAHGELTGILIIRAWHRAQGKPRHKIIVPDTAHGTNPATSALAGFSVVEIKTGPEGYLLPEAVAAVMDEDTAGIMVTNPNTLGVFEQRFDEIARIVHAKGGLVYMDGANFNALMGYVRPGDIGVDVMHFNLHKTFSTPHGGGGPGSGPVGVTAELAPFLPAPVVIKTDAGYRLDYDRPHSIGRMRSYFGNFGMMIRGLAYILEMGGEGLKEATQHAVLNANYIRTQLEPYYDLPYATASMHECVFSDHRQKEKGVSNVDLVKDLMDHGFHPPTMSFPLVVHGALMIEPTETESKEDLDEFCQALIDVAKKADEQPESLHESPRWVFRRRLDDVLAARAPKLTWRMLERE